MKKIGSFVLVLGLGACQAIEKHKKHDPYLDLTRDQTRQAFKPPVAELIAEPLRPLALKPEQNLSKKLPPQARKKISLSTTSTVPLKNIFHSLARDSHLNISVDDNVKGGLMYHAPMREAGLIIKDLCRGANLRYTVHDDVIHIENDSAYTKTYQVQYLTLNRKNESRISIATDIFTSSDSQKNQVDNGSNALITGSSHSDFWQELEANIQALLKNDGDNTHYTIHKQAGLLSVSTSDKGHEKIQDYLRTLERTMTAQVLIEAKIIEVQLSEDFKSGVNWSSFKGDAVIRMPFGDVTTPGPFDPHLVTPRDVMTLGGAGRHFTGLIHFLNTFGTVRTLSNPRLTVMNNQSAILKVATNEVFFRVNYNRETGLTNTREREQVSSDIQTVPIGLVMMVHPAINIEKQNIIMTLRPTISRIVDQKEDPAVTILSQQKQKSLIPQVQVREFDSVVNVVSGYPIIMAGLMDDRGDMQESGIPDAEDIPLLGMLFKGKSSSQKKTELVIFIQAHIIPPVQSLKTITAQDKQVYQTFSQDPRPLHF